MRSPSRSWTAVADERVSSESSAGDLEARLLWSPDQERRARIQVACNAIDAEDRRDLLELLGLVP